MFKLSPELTFPWPVKVIEPDPVNAGRLIEHEFEATFAILDPDEIKVTAAARRQILQRVTPDTPNEELKKIDAELAEHDRVALRRVVRGWSKILDAAGQPLPFNEQTFIAAYAHERVRNAFDRAYQEAISEDKARLGN